MGEATAVGVVLVGAVQLAGDFVGDDAIAQAQVGEGKPASSHLTRPAQVPWTRHTEDFTGSSDHEAPAIS